MLKQVTSLNQFIHDTQFEDIPKDVVHQARRCLLDLLGVWMSGCNTAPARIARDHAAKRYGAAEGAITLAFDGRAVSPPGYAFAGAIAIDSIDGHDGHQVCKGHAGAALLPALLAELGDTPKIDLNAFLTHLIVGYEVAIRAGLSLHASVPDYHSSGAWSSLGCAAMGARVRYLSEEQTRHALGIAEYYGPRAQMMRCIDHPTMVKDSTGWGSMVGVSATDLAQDGFTGAPALVCEAEEASSYWTDIGQTWRMREMNFKAYPVCRWAQPPIEAMRQVMTEHQFAVSDVKEILVTTFHEATRLATRRPTGSDEAQFSLCISVALALLHGTVLPKHLQPDYFQRPEVLAIGDLIQFAEADQYNAEFPAERRADVTVTLKDGRKFRSKPHAARGNHDNPLSDEELVAKFLAYCAPKLSEHRQAELAALLTDPTGGQTLDGVLSALVEQRSS